MVGASFLKPKYRAWLPFNQFWEGFPRNMLDALSQVMAMCSFNGGKRSAMKCLIPWMFDGSIMVFQRVKHWVEVRNIWDSVVDIGWMAFRHGF